MASLVGSSNRDRHVDLVGGGKSPRLAVASRRLCRSALYRLHLQLDVDLLGGEHAAGLEDLDPGEPEVARSTDVFAVKDPPHRWMLAASISTATARS